MDTYTSQMRPVIKELKTKYPRQLSVGLVPFLKAVAPYRVKIVKACPVCSTKNKDREKFCRCCGFILDDEIRRNQARRMEWREELADGYERIVCVASMNKVLDNYLYMTNITEQLIWLVNVQKTNLESIMSHVQIESADFLNPNQRKIIKGLILIGEQVEDMKECISRLAQLGAFIENEFRNSKTVHIPSNSEREYNHYLQRMKQRQFEIDGIFQE